MALQIYDFRRESDICNMLVTPHIRSRFLRMRPGQIADLHSHDLGHEIFLILQGRAHFRVAGEEAELGPGQLCIALVDEIHQVRVVGDEEMIMYLSVTPHIQPTHTGRDEDGTRHPVRFVPSGAYDAETDTKTPLDALVDRFVDEAQTMARVAQESAQRQADWAQKLKAALAGGDDEAACDAREAMWAGVYQTFKQIYAMGDVWNDLTPRAGSTK